MNDKDRLIALLNEGDKIAGEKIHKSIYDFVKEHHHFSSKDDADKIPVRQELVADYLLDNGVIVLPVKVGDTVYEIFRSRDLRQRKVVEILIGEEPSFVVGGDIYSEERYHFSLFGKTVFLAKEEAEKALEAARRNKSE